MSRNGRRSWGCPSPEAKIRSVGRSEREGQLLGSRRGSKGCRIKKENKWARERRWLINSSSVYRMNRDAFARLCPSVPFCLDISAAPQEEKWSGKRQHQPCVALPLGAWACGPCHAVGAARAGFFCPPRNQQEKLSNSRSPTRHQDREAAPYRGSS